MLKRLFCVFTAVLLTAATLTGCWQKKVTREDFTEEQLDSSVYDVEKYTTPFWEGNIVYNEAVFPIMNENNELEPFELMYYADDIISVKDYTLQIEYTEGEDYFLEDGKLVIIPTGKIRFRGYDFIHRDNVIQDKIVNDVYPFYPKKDSDGYVYWSEEEDIFLNNLSVTYIHNDEWKYSIAASQTKELPQTVSKLNSGEEITIVIEGDSISCGMSSSSKYKVPPFADNYIEMSKKIISDRYNNHNINIINSAVGGASAEFPEEQIKDSVIKHNPDLVIIAFGMNDASSGVSAEIYKSNIENHILYLKNELPDCEILLISSLYGNPLTFSKELYEDHAKALYEIANDTEGVAVCDPQSIMNGLLEKKDYLCFMADNMVHPNDYGMRIIAQCVIAALTE